MRTFGCDIGNGFAYVSVLNEAGRPECTLPPQWAAASGMPAEAYVREDGTIDVAGLGAVSHRDPGRIVRAVKRSLARGTIELTPSDGEGCTSVDAAAVYSAIAKRALDASAQTMLARGDTPPHDVVLAYPASFADSRRLIGTMQSAIACLQATDGGCLNVVGSIPEPAAIALDFLYFMRHEVEASRRLDARDVNVIVYDLGHGTFDTALVSARAILPGSEERPWDLHDFDGIPDVGGIDFDNVLIDLFRQQFEPITSTGLPDSYMEDLLREHAVRCKHELTEAESTLVRFFLSDGSPVRFEVTREQFEAASQHLLDQTLDKVRVMFDSARRLGLPVTHVVLSGGASRMPMVRRSIEQLVPAGVSVSVFRPSEAVSFGAARYGATLRMPQLHTLPIDDAATAEQRMDQLFLPLIVPDETEPMPKPAEPILLQHAPHPLGVLYSGKHGRMMLVLVPRGATTSSTSAPGQLKVRADGSHIELVVARAIDPHTSKRRIGEGGFREVCHLRCERAVTDTVYDVRIKLEEDGMITGSLTDNRGRTLPMEMS